MSAPLASDFTAARADPALVVLEGFHALKHALRFSALVQRAVTSDPDGLAALSAELAPDLAATLRELVRPISREELRALGCSRPPHTGVVAIAQRPAFSLARVLARDPLAQRPVVLLEDPRHLGNVGAVVRVAAGAEAAGVVTTGARDPWDPAAVRGAAGLHFALPVGRAALEEVVGGAGGVGAGDAAADPRDAATGEAGAGARRPLVALDPDGDPLHASTLPPDALLAFGTERHGLSDELLAHADRRLRIPMRAGVSSLNLATAVAAVLFARTLGG